MSTYSGSSRWRTLRRFIHDLEAFAFGSRRNSKKSFYRGRRDALIHKFISWDDFFDLSAFLSLSMFHTGPTTFACATNPNLRTSLYGNITILVTRSQSHSGLHTPSSAWGCRWRHAAIFQDNYTRLVPVPGTPHTVPAACSSRVN